MIAVFDLGREHGRFTVVEGEQGEHEGSAKGARGSTKGARGRSTRGAAQGSLNLAAS